MACFRAVTHEDCVRSFASPLRDAQPFLRRLVAANMGTEGGVRARGRVYEAARRGVVCARVRVRRDEEWKCGGVTSDRYSDTGGE